MLADHIGMPKLRDMASKSERVEINVSLADLPRIAGLLYPDFAASGQRIRMEFEFRRGTQGLPEINGSASGRVGLCCQRCLGLLEWPVDVTFSLAVAESEAELAKSATPFDTVLATDAGVSLLDLCEDELLASLPLAPVHEDRAMCSFAGSAYVAEQPDVLEVEDGQGAGAANKADVSRPFAGLAALLKQRSGPGSKNG